MIHNLRFMNQEKEVPKKIIMVERIVVTAKESGRATRTYTHLYCNPFLILALPVFLLLLFFFLIHARLSLSISSKNWHALFSGIDNSNSVTWAITSVVLCRIVHSQDSRKKRKKKNSLLLASSRYYKSPVPQRARQVRTQCI